MEWRIQYKPDLIDPSEVEPEAITGRALISGYSKKGNPLLFLIPAKERAADTTPERQLRYSVFNLEQAIKLMPEGVEKLVLVIDQENVTRANKTPLSVSLEWLNIFSSHYPERLALGIMCKPSWYLSVLLTMLGPFLDPVTKSKINFYDSAKGVQAGNNNGTGGWINILDVIDADQLPVQYGGTIEFEYDHSVYWSKITAL
ncbi:CRAL-TRIO domain-containing protein [Chytriomyces sp. MP71]|nr:CRAL-TRIO domain-containing protein [Chytriomyces sp. MP71]